MLTRPASEPFDTDEAASAVFAFVIGAMTAFESVPLVPFAEADVEDAEEALLAVASIAGSFVLHPVKINSAAAALYSATRFIMLYPLKLNMAVF